MGRLGRFTLTQRASHELGPCMKLAHSANTANCKQACPHAAQTGDDRGPPTVRPVARSTSIESPQTPGASRNCARPAREPCGRQVTASPVQGPQRTAAPHRPPHPSPAPPAHAHPALSPHEPPPCADRPISLSRERTHTRRRKTPARIRGRVRVRGVHVRRVVRARSAAPPTVPPLS